MSLGVPASGLEVNLNGPGPTPFTREGLSGRKALPSLIKKFVQSEALHRLGIPTGRRGQRGMPAAAVAFAAAH